MGGVLKIVRSIVVVLLAIALGDNGSALSDGLPAPAGGKPGMAYRQAFVEALRPSRAQVPIVVVLALNEGTETTDFLVPHAVLKRAGGAEVIAAAPRAGRVQLMPALAVSVATDLAGFDAAYPEGADVVVVPAMHRDDDPVILQWLREQSSKGAKIIGICSGALVLGRAGLLDGREFTSHWFDRSALIRAHPTARFVADRRYVVDRGIATTTGVSASLPAALALAAALTSEARADALAHDIGASDWSAGHDSARFTLTAARIGTLILSTLQFWRNERIGIPVDDGVDDIALAFAADAWSRTARSNAVAVSGRPGPARMASGLVLDTAPRSMADVVLPLRGDDPSTRSLRRSLCGIDRRYGESTRDWVALLMEIDGPAACEGNPPAREN